MTDKEIRLRKLQTFKRRKYQCEGFLNVDVSAFQAYLNRCIDVLHDGIEKDYSKQQLKSIFGRYLPGIRSMAIGHTAEREFICKELYELSNIVDVNIKFRLNQIMYGTLFALLAMLPKRKHKGEREPNYEKTAITCTECGYVMEIYVLIHFDQDDATRLRGLWEGKVIVECPLCGAYNLVYIDDDRSGSASGDYRVIENLHNDYSRDEAEQRLRQMKYWRP